MTFTTRRQSDRRRTFRILREVMTIAICCVLLLALMAGANAQETNYNYYCPKGNGALLGNDHFLMGKMSTPFPAGSASPRPGAMFSQPLNWTLSDCSDRQFICFDAHDAGTNSMRRIFVPRDPIIGKTYQNASASAFVIGSSSFDKIPTIQVIVSQQVSGHTVALKLTIRQGVGAIYIDGLNFWNSSDYQNGETCALESRVGFFSKTHVTTAAPQRVIDD